MAEQREVAKPGCFSRFLRHLLCAHPNNAPPIRPSDHFPPRQTLPYSLPNKPPFDPNPIPASPGVVARLMGLDSLPNTSRVSSRVAPESVPRSKSVNFIDYLLQFDQEGGHRRVRTSSSFREVHASSTSSTSLPFQSEKNRDVVVFLWDDAAESKSTPSEAVRRSTRKHEVDLKEMKKQRSKEKNEGTKKKKISKLKNEPRRVSGSNSISLSRGMRKEAFVEPRFGKRVRSKKSLKKVENESCSENLSPLSVLDVRDDQDFTFQNQTNFTDETKGLCPKSKRKSSAQRCLFEDRGSSHKSETEHCSDQLMANLRKLTEKDVKLWDCGPKGMFGSECFEEISLVFEHKIFDLLLREVVHELLTFS